MDLTNETLNAIADDFSTRTEGEFSLVVLPLPDDMGYLSTVCTASGGEVARGAGPTVVTAMTRAMDRALVAVAEVDAQIAAMTATSDDEDED